MSHVSRLLLLFPLFPIIFILYIVCFSGSKIKEIDIEREVVVYFVNVQYSRIGVVMAFLQKKAEPVVVEVAESRSVVVFSPADRRTLIRK